MLFTVLALLIGAASSAATPARAEQPDATRPTPEGRAASAVRTLRVTGEGRTLVSPDLALVTLGVVAVDPSLAKATQDANERARRIRTAITQAGVAGADVQTSRYDVEVERRIADRGESPPRITGYRVSNEIRVKVRDLAHLGSILDRVVGAGANEVQGLAFAKEDTSAEQARALASGVRSARAKAEEMARAAGVSLGELVELSEGVRGPRPIQFPMRSMADAAGVPVSPGQLEIEAQVEAVYAIH